MCEFKSRMALLQFNEPNAELTMPPVVISVFMVLVPLNKFRLKNVVGNVPLIC
ncbi:MAG: hypothetical protein BWY67_02243 [Bacteroidetes bacterium ADurb.Bin397]|nr:MAG: hypothetical protein BWY67_02243 [Bacteroidetes bacterium ADurb.Bin397]